MSYDIEIQNDDDYPIDGDKLTQAAQMALKMQVAPLGCGLTVVITDDAAVQALNLSFRDINAATDVLSFPADEPPAPVQTEAPYLGDIIIAHPYAMAQAEREGHDATHSLMLLVVHGVLHLLGFDHDTAHNRAIMWAQQAAILQALGIPAEIVPALEGANDGEEG